MEPINQGFGANSLKVLRNMYDNKELYNKWVEILNKKDSDFIGKCNEYDSSYLYNLKECSLKELEKIANIIKDENIYVSLYTAKKLLEAENVEEGKELIHLAKTKKYGSGIHINECLNVQAPLKEIIEYLKGCDETDYIKTEIF